MMKNNIFLKMKLFNSQWYKESNWPDFMKIVILERMKQLKTN